MRRQAWVGPFAPGFRRLDARLIDDADGSRHGENEQYDLRRDAYLRNEGYRVIRVWSNELADDLAGVPESIHRALLERVPSSAHPAVPGWPLPLGRGEGL
ncbi:DUF559 domain-containing protein [Rhizorhabdus sp.]|uniref:endonuclease domain-containing protein n=1 Tax=Rhizorhabdus sp. TaxID=1968843 RepID=UPI00198E0250|nr:DUF559 domain-containing protein [Rhizorhabdus sp.]